MVGRTTTTLLIYLRRALRRPLISATIVFVEIAIILSLLFHMFECKHGPPYDTYLRTLHGMMVLVISGFDVDPPRSTGAIICSYVLMVSGITYVGFFTAVIAAAFVESKLRKGITMGKITFTNHILICGCVKRSAEILSQLFAPDLKEHRPVVIIDPEIEQAPMDHPLLKVIRGDPTETEVLERANARSAYAAIVLANRDVADRNVADARSLLLALAIETLQPEIYSCVEVLNPKNVKHFERANVDEVISVSEISNSLAVHAALNPGVSRLVLEMVNFGEGVELYRIPVPPDFVGRSFADLACVLTDQHDMVPVGVDTTDGDAGGAGRRIVHSHPSGWRFRDGDYVFVLAEDQPDDLSGVTYNVEVTRTG